MTNPNILHKKLLWNIQLWQVFTFLGLYLFFALQYWLTIYYASNGYSNQWRETLIDYFLLKIPLTIPLWWLYFVHWNKKSIRFKIIMHLITACLWVGLWFFVYRAVQDLRGSRYLTGSGSWWDVYIPFLVYCIQFSMFHLYDFYLHYTREKERQQYLLELAHANEMSALKAQIQPHFLFNTLNSISASVPLEMERTRELIAKLAETFRYSLQASQREWITLEEELHFIRVMLDLEQERLKQRLRVVFDIDESALLTKVPPMLLQPLAENAIKHGIAPNMDGGTVIISVKNIHGKVHVSISDTGAGYAGDIQEMISTKGLGLKNTYQRLEKLYGEKIKVKQNIPAGLNFSFNIPV